MAGKSNLNETPQEGAEMKLISTLVAGIVVVAAALAIAFHCAANEKVEAAKARLDICPEGSSWISGPGLVEPRSEIINVGIETSGMIRSICVEEGDHVEKGQLLAWLSNDENKAQVAIAEAELKKSKAELDEQLNGSRPEEIEEARANVKEMSTNADYAKLQMARQTRLHGIEALSARELEVAEREFKTYEAKLSSTKQHLALLEAGSRKEEIVKAEAALASAAASLEEAKATLEKTCVKAPINGVVLRNYHRPGETVTLYSTSPDPLFALGDMSSLRVRVEIDEADVAKLKQGAKAYVAAKAFPGKRFQGKVIKSSQILGRKHVFTGEPQEFSDTRILETIIELDSGSRLPVGLRVDAFILLGE